MAMQGLHHVGISQSPNVTTDKAHVCFDPAFKKQCRGQSKTKAAYVRKEMQSTVMMSNWYAVGCKKLHHIWGIYRSGIITEPLVKD